MEDVVILSAARTPIGSFLGELAPLSTPQLGSQAIAAALERAGVEPASVDQVLMGCVLQAGLGQAPARQASIGAGLPHTTGAITVNKVCGSGMRALMDGANGLRLGEWDIVVSGGMESMSNAPHLLAGARRGYRMGGFEGTDAMIKDGLWDPYNDQHMGNCAELCAREYSFTRAAQDDFARQSYERARAASENGQLERELLTVSVPQRKGEPVTVARDEEPFAAPLEKMGTLRPAFQRDGTVTAANASKINDGAAALVVTTAKRAATLGCQPLVRVVAQGAFAQAPEWFTTAPAGAARQALKRAGLSVADVGLWEINEAFATVALAAIHDLDLDPTTVNVRGGAVALGHPIGASGARIVTTLVHAMLSEKVRYGCASICLGGGEATAVVLENLQDDARG